MFSKTTLSAAIAVALSMGISATAQASFNDLSQITFNQCTPPAAGVTTECETFTDTVKYAYEQFSDASNGELSFPFRVLYRPASNKLSGYDLYVNFTLNGGATWGKIGPTTDDFAIENDSGQVLPLGNISIARVAKDAVSFRVAKGTPITTNHLLRFKFTLGNAQAALKTIGGQITLTADFKVARNTDPTDSASNPVANTPTRTVSLASSVVGANVSLKPTLNPKVFINVEDGKSFIVGGTSTVEVAYGTVEVSAASPGGIAANSLSAQSGFLRGTAGQAPFNIGKFQLSINDGNFKASGALSEGKVYIDLGDGDKLIASTISADKLTATWNYDASIAADFILLDKLKVGATPKNIMLTVNGTDDINENRKVAPTGMLSVGGINRPATLRHLKRNGSVCTVYNIPNTDALDLVHIRVTNDSATAGFVKGSLRDMDGKDIFKGKMLIDVGGLAPHQTVHLGMAELTSNGETWGGRGVLTLESNIPEPYMQVYALLRAAGLPDEFPESPLMNLSTGASGNGCD